MNRSKILPALCVLAAVLSAHGCASSTAGGPDGQLYTATLADVGDALVGTTTAPVWIRIEEFSTLEEIDRLSDVLAERGPDAVKQEIAELDKGWLRIGDSLGYPLMVIRSQPQGQGRQIEMLVDRPVTFYERWRSTRSADYPFAYIQLQIGPDGQGEGQFIPAVQVRLDGATGRIEVVGYGVQPARLMNVRARQR